MDPRVLLVMTTVPDLDTGERLARLLVEARLAACVNIIAGVTSIYRWQGAVEQASEYQLLIKTSARRYHAVEEALRAHHPYETPEIIAVPVIDGSPAYLRWLTDESDPREPVYA
jgi:periplasmic divalent cation tolerance protein